jgi:hypothetical protein
MTMFTRLLTAALAAGGVAAPAAAQTSYPYPQPYPQTYPGYQGQGGNVIGSVIDQLLGNRYSVTDRTAVSQCASAAVAQASREYRPNGYGQGSNPGYGQGYGNQGYGGQGYGYNGYGNMRVTAITDVQRRSSGLRVRGLIDSGMGYRPYGNQGGQGYGGQGYAGGGYGGGDLTFRCNVDYRGYVTNVRVSRNDNYRRY